MIRLTLTLISLLLLAACAGSADQRDLASAPAFESQPLTVEVDEYLAFLDELALAIGEGVPRDLNTREREQFRDTDSRLRQLLEPVARVDQLSEENQTLVFNLHQKLQGIVVGDPDNYLICSQRHTVGTHFKRTSCIPAGDFRREQERNREALRNRLGPGPMPVLTTP